ncbi:hypothetical protein PQG02_23800 [Nostoc sp. UHCC 0926]|nr:hypothetical protein [Nostoc sp. UHCC 0926]WDD31692.1 hypothetical protein PQG02_23800 [Nostoc sp. UHCC 0926]
MSIDPIAFIAVLLGMGSTRAIANLRNVEFRINHRFVDDVTELDYRLF